MVIEIVDIEIDPAQASTFEAAVEEAQNQFRNASGCHGMALYRVVEDAALYRLHVLWDSVEDHMVTFRNSPAFAEWRRLAGPFFVRPPNVVHLDDGKRFF